MATVPDDVRRLIASADALRDAGSFDDALSAYQAIVAEFPESHEAHYKLATCFARLEKIDDAERCYREAISRWSEYPEANNNLALILFGRGELDEAERLYRIALAERTDFFQGHLNLCRLLHETRRLPEAKYYADRARTINPKSADAYVQLGQVLLLLGQISASLVQFQRAAELDPESASVLTHLASCYGQLGRYGEATDALMSALAIAPDFLWAWNVLLLTSNYRLRDRSEVFNLHRSFNEIVRKQCGEMADPHYSAKPDVGRRLRVGFLSGDLRQHSVSYFVRSAVEHLNRGQFQLFAYYTYRTEDEVTCKLKPSFHHWRCIYGVPDADAAALIKKDRIDILVDLSGHTTASRPMVMGSMPFRVETDERRVV